MLIFPLKKEWYEKIKSGEKTIEYREVKPYWSGRIHREVYKKYTNEEVDNRAHENGIRDLSLPCKLRLGYSNHYMSAIINKIDYIKDGRDTDLAIDKPVYAIHLTDVRECVC